MAQKTRRKGEIMKRNYGISILLCTAILCALYAGSYQSMYAEESQTENTEEFSIAPAEAGREKKLYQYCLKEKDGYVYVYLADGKTIYEPTSILLEELPKNIRKKIKKGLYLLDDQELYSFLENYSS